MSVATPLDVADRFGLPVDTQLAQVLLDDVEAIILGRIPDLLGQVAAVPPTINQAAVVKVESWAVVRYLKNPDGKYQERLDDYSFMRDRSVAAGALYISDDEWAELLPGDVDASAAFTIRTDYIAANASGGPNYWWDTPDSWSP